MDISPIFWQQLTYLGDVAVTLPLAAMLTVYLLIVDARRLAAYWSVLFGGAMALVVVSKLAFIGWGIGSASLDFTGFSGHATRAIALYPLEVYLMIGRHANRRARWSGVVLALLLALLITYSRIVVHAHSVSGVVSGAALGLLVALLMLRGARVQPMLLGNTQRQRWLIATSMLGLILPCVLLQLHAAPATPTQQMLTRIALRLSGHARPHTRAEWHNGYGLQSLHACCAAPRTAAGA